MIEKALKAWDKVNNPPLEKDIEKHYIKKKVVEECCELSAALMQSLNKKELFNEQQIEDEIADVLMWVNKLADYYDKAYIDARHVKKLQTYFKNETLCRDCI